MYDAMTAIEYLSEINVSRISISISNYRTLLLLCSDILLLDKHKQMQCL